MSFFDLFRQKENNTNDTASDIAPTPAQLAKAKIVADEKYDAARKFVDRHYRPNLRELLSNPNQYKPSKYANESGNGTSSGNASSSTETNSSSTSNATSSGSTSSPAGSTPSCSYSAKEEYPAGEADLSLSLSDNNARYSISEGEAVYADEFFDNAEFSAISFMEQLYSLDARKDSVIINALLSMSFSTFTSMLMKEKGLTAAEVYKKAQIDKSTFSKILSLPSYSPTKDTAIAVCLGLTLNITEAKTLLGKAGYTLSNSILRDVIVRFSIETQMFDVVMVNCLLEKFGCRPLGRC